MEYRNIDRKFRSTVTVAYSVEVTSVGLAHARPIIFSRKPPSHFDVFPSLSISSSPIERVASLVSYCHLTSPGPPTYPQFVVNPVASWVSSSGTFIPIPSPLLSSSSIYVSLVRPHLEYCSAIWAPSSPSLCHRIDSVQLFAIKLASKFRPSLISSIQSCFNLPSLSSRCLHSKLIIIFKIHHNLLHFPPCSASYSTSSLPYPLFSQM